MIISALIGTHRKNRMRMEAADDLHAHGDSLMPLPGHHLQVTISIGNNLYSLSLITIIHQSY